MIFIDQMGREVVLSEFPKRIISLVPSQTELLFDLGLVAETVGVTKFCIHPAPLVKAATKVGGTKNFKLDLIEQLQPELIIGNMEENYQEGINYLEKRYPVWMSNIFTLFDAMQMILSLGTITGKEVEAKSLVVDIQHQFEQLQPCKQIKAAYFIWKKPYMTVGANTFIDDMLRRCGFVNVFGHLKRYPEVQPEHIAQAAPEVILLSSEPYPFKEKHIEEFQQLCPAAKVLVVDGEMFSWYGSRLRFAAPYFNRLLASL